MTNLEDDLKQNADKQVAEALMSLVSLQNAALASNQIQSTKDRDCVFDSVDTIRKPLKAYRAQQTPVATSDVGEALDRLVCCANFGGLTDNCFKGIAEDEKTIRQALTSKQPVGVEAIAEVIFNSRRYAMVGSWAEMKDQFVGDNKSRNCWKGVHAGCLDEAKAIAKQYDFVKKGE